MGNELVIHERYNGTDIQIWMNGQGIQTTKKDVSAIGTHHRGRLYLIDLMTRMFLPVGYPNSVSPDYLQYQILNALQAFCNSLASLISSRAILQGFGVGDPTATPTKALLLTVLQDVFSRFTTILSAHFFGSSLSPEAKTFRLLADVLNDTAVILDTLSPALNSLPIPGLRVSSLCLSAIFKSLCGIAAGGSKAAITMHFATPVNNKGDVGDLNAKDSSKETVLALFGMLAGTLIVPYLITAWSTYTALFILVGLHLAINYYGVRGIVLRTLNRQRLGITWTSFRGSQMSTVPYPSQVAEAERIFERPGSIYDISTGSLLGFCTTGSSFSQILRGPIPTGLFDVFREEKYIIWFDQLSLLPSDQGSETTLLHGPKQVHICLKQGYTNDDLLKAWVHAVEICHSTGRRAPHGSTSETLQAMDTIETSHDTITKYFREFVANLRAAGWDTVDCPIMTGLPNAVVTAVTSGIDTNLEDKKSR